jgi:hypothetical protein
MTRIAPNSPAAQRFVKNLEAQKPKKTKEQQLQQVIGKKPPGLEQIKRFAHNLNVSKGLKGAIQDQLKLVRFGQPLNKADSPRTGKNGQMTAPNGDPLIRVKLSDSNGISGSSQYALVNPKTNEYYVQTNGGGFARPTTYNGPLSLPQGSRFQGDKFTPADLKTFEAHANKPPTLPPTLKELQKKLEGLEYGHPAPDPKNVLKETVIKSQHPFTYYAVTLKGDPNHVVIKKVLTGGFVPAKPGDGTYTAPIEIS